LPPGSRTAPPLGAHGLAAGQAAAPGGAGRRQGSGAGHSPGEREEEGAVAPSTEKEGGFAPLSTCTGAQAGPLAAHGRRRTAGGAPNWGGAGHPKERRRGLLPPPQKRTGGLRPPGRAQGRRRHAGGGQSPPGMPEEEGIAGDDGDGRI